MPMPDLRIDFKKNEKQILIFIMLVSASVVLVYFNFILSPQVRWMADVFIRMNRASGDLKNAKDSIRQIPKFKKDISDYKEKVDSYERMLPAEQEIPTLLESLSSMAKSSGVHIEGIMPAVRKEEKAQANQVYQEIPINISASSGYHELGQFLAKLDNAERFMKVADIKITANKLTPKRHNVDLWVLTYILAKGK